MNIANSYYFGGQHFMFTFCDVNNKMNYQESVDWKVWCLLYVTVLDPPAGKENPEGYRLWRCWWSQTPLDLAFARFAEQTSAAPTKKDNKDHKHCMLFTLSCIVCIVSPRTVCLLKPRSPGLWRSYSTCWPVWGAARAARQNNILSYNTNTTKDCHIPQVLSNNSTCWR